MILAVANITTVWLAMLGLKAILDSGKNDIKKVMKIGGGFAAFCLVLVALGGTLFDFESQAVSNGVSSDDKFEERMTSMTKSKDFGTAIIESIKEDRVDIMRKDSIRSLALILLALSLIFFYLKGKLKETHLGIIMAFLILMEVIFRYLNTYPKTLN